MALERKKAGEAKDELVGSLGVEDGGGDATAEPAKDGIATADETNGTGDALTTGPAEAVPEAVPKASSAADEAAAPANRRHPGFFSRMSSLGSTAAPIWGDVYDRAMGRAAQLREQATAGAERLRQQQQKQQHRTDEVAIPPLVGTLVVGSHPKKDEPPAAEEEATGEVTKMEVDPQTSTKDLDGHGPEAAASNGAGESAVSTIPANDIRHPRKDAVNSTLSPLRDAFEMAKQTSADVAQELLFPMDAFAAPIKDEGDRFPVSSGDSANDYSSSSQDNGYYSKGTGADNVEGEKASKDGVVVDDSVTNDSDGSAGATVTSSAPTLTPTRFSAATSALSNAVGLRYRRLKESTSFDSSPLSPLPKRVASPVVVGGADRVGGLRHFQMDNIFDALPPTMPLSGRKTDPFDQSPPGRDNLAVRTGGQWTMASNRGPNALIASAVTTAPASNDAASATTSETASEEAPVASTPPVGKLPPSKAKQGRASYYEQAVRSVLWPGQRALFFGKGTMGVVLKPTYLASWRGKDGGGLLSPTAIATKGGKKGGVFIDSLVPGGHAEKSGVVFVGDQVIKIGAVNVENMTLEEVVSVILETKRPNIMVLSSEHTVRVVDKPDGSEGTMRAFISPLDLVFGFTNKMVAEGGWNFKPQEKARNNARKEKGTKPPIKLISLLDDDGDAEEDTATNGDEEEVFFDSPVKAAEVGGTGSYDRISSFNVVSLVPGIGHADKEHAGEKSDTELEVVLAQADTMNLPSYHIETLLGHASHRTNTHSGDAETQHKISSSLKRAALFRLDFQNALRLSLSECIADPRRYSFLAHFFRNFQNKRMEARECRVKRQNSNDFKEAREGDDDPTSSQNQRRLLNLYLQLCKFHDAMMVCSALDREKLLGYARKLSMLFLVEDGTDGLGDSSCLSEYVAHVALGGTEKVQAIRFTLRNKDEFFNSENSHDGFDSIRSHLEAFLSMQESYLSFLISDDCARMRAYLHGSSPYLCVRPQAFLKSCAHDGMDGMHHNFLVHAILHLICMRENKNKESEEKEANFIKNDALLLSSGQRNMGAASLLGCAIFIMRSLKKSIEAAIEGLIKDGMTSTSSNVQLHLALNEDIEFFWRVFIAPAGGSLSSLALSQDAQEALDTTRRVIVSSVEKVLEGESSDTDTALAVAIMLSSSEVSSAIGCLGEALLREYTLKIYPGFCRHIFHEWACKEAKECGYDGKDHIVINEHLVSSEFKGLSKGWMNRFLRQMEFPDGISLHRPTPSISLPKEFSRGTSTTAVAPCFHNGDLALVFGSDNEEDEGAHPEENSIRRFSCVSLRPETDCPNKSVLLPDDIPPIFESYAMVPPFCERPFQGMLHDEQNHRKSIDGWEVSLTNFVIPLQASTDSDDDRWMFCVSLVLRKSSSEKFQISEREVNGECLCELEHDESASKATVRDFESPIFYVESENGRNRKMRVSQELKVFNVKLQEQKWSQQFGQGATVGLSLISSRNVTHVMRDTLSLLYSDICSVKSSSEDKRSQHLCRPLVEILGVLSHSQVEASSLKCLLQPYIACITARWVDRPLSDQSAMFSEAAGLQLLQALPPVPLALTFVTLLLEQKVVVASSRRGMLMSASFATTQLLKPLKWAHLQVPLVPDTMLNELIHYPAPFLIGIATDEKESAAILSALPSDVTLVDLDVGRVILASVFVDDSSKSGEGKNGKAAAGALRSQVLFLAEYLGGAFGAAIHRDSWCSDSPLQVTSFERGTSASPSLGTFPEVVSICEEFVTELLSGIYSCCLWLEERHDHEASTRNESAIVFDEERFYHIKHLRAEGRYLPLIQKKSDERSSKRSLSLDHFDLIFETFLRTQCLSTYISDGKKESMLFW